MLRHVPIRGQSRRLSQKIEFATSSFPWPSMSFVAFSISSTSASSGLFVFRFPLANFVPRLLDVASQRLTEPFLHLIGSRAGQWLVKRVREGQKRATNLRVCYQRTQHRCYRSHAHSQHRGRAGKARRSKASVQNPQDEGMAQ
jgi:hypothetical protein